MGLSFSTVLEFGLTSLLIELTPGPNMTYLALIAARAGRRAGYSATAGVAVGLAAVGLAASLGLAEVISSTPFLYSIFRWAGVAYISYLAWEAWRDTNREIDISVASNGRFFARGLITNLLNPKAAIFYITVLPSFLDVSLPLGAQAVVLSAVYVLVATSIHLAIVTGAGSLQSVMINRRVRKYSGRLFAIALMGVAVWVFLTTGN